MPKGTELDYARVEQAILYIQEYLHEQPSLDEISAVVRLSPFHFQRLFTAWAGVSPKKFMQYLSLEYAKFLLQESRCSLLDAAYETGLSGAGRLHDLFVKIEAMTPGEFKQGGSGLAINYSCMETQFGKMLVASTQRGVCRMQFLKTEEQALADLQRQFPNATYQQQSDQHQQDAMLLFKRDWNQLNQIKLHLLGTPFQIKVWESLLKIPSGALMTYGDVAGDIDKPKAARAVGSAIGKNPIAYIIPCHRVIQQTGNLGGYRWGTARKAAIIGWEAALHNER